MPSNARTHRLTVLFSSIALTGAAHAGIAPNIQFEIDASDGFSTSFAPTGSPVSGDIYNYQGTEGNSNFTLDYDFDADAHTAAPEGAFLGTGFTLTNDSLDTMEFTIRVTMDLATAAGGDAFYGGSAGWTLTGIDGHFQTAGADSIWHAYADGVEFDSLFYAPFWIDFTGAGTGSSSEDTLGFVGGSIDDSIGIMMHFTLSAGDTLTHTGALGVIPAPTALAVFGMAALAGGRRRRQTPLSDR